MATIINRIHAASNSLSGMALPTFKDAVQTDGFIELPILPQKKLKKKCCKKYQRKGRHCKCCPKLYKKK